MYFDHFSRRHPSSKKGLGNPLGNFCVHTCSVLSFPLWPPDMMSIICLATFSANYITKSSMNSNKQAKKYNVNETSQISGINRTIQL